MLQGVPRGGGVNTPCNGEWEKLNLPCRKVKTKQKIHNCNCVWWEVNFTGGGGQGRPPPVSVDPPLQSCVMFCCCSGLGFSVRSVAVLSHGVGGEAFLVQLHDAVVLSTEVRRKLGLWIQRSRNQKIRSKKRRLL